MPRRSRVSAGSTAQGRDAAAGRVTFCGLAAKTLLALAKKLDTRFNSRIKSEGAHHEFGKRYATLRE